MLACGEAIDEGKAIAEALCELLSAEVPLTIAADLKDLYNSLSPRGVALDKSIRADINVIRYEFETRMIHQLVWVPG